MALSSIQNLLISSKCSSLTSIVLDVQYSSAIVMKFTLINCLSLLVLVSISSGCSNGLSNSPDLPISDPSGITTGMIVALNNVEEGLGSRQDLDGLLFCLVERGYSRAQLSKPYYNIGGVFYDRKYSSLEGPAVFENRISAGRIQFNTLAFDYSRYWPMMYHGKFQSLEESQLQRFDSVHISVEGESTNEVPHMELHMNFYKEIEFEECDVFTDSISKSSSPTVRWNKDSTNTHGVVVFVSGRSSSLSFSDKTFQWTRVTDDDGEFVIPQQVLEDLSSAITSTNRFRVSISRGNGEVLEEGSKRYAVIGASTASNSLYWK